MTRTEWLYEQLAWHESQVKHYRAKLLAATVLPTKTRRTTLADLNGSGEPKNSGPAHLAKRNTWMPPYGKKETK